MGCQFLLQGNLPHPGIKPSSLASSAWHADSLLLCHLGSLKVTIFQLNVYIYIYINRPPGPHLTPGCSLPPIPATIHTTFLKACHALGLTLSMAPHSPTLASKALWEVNPAHSPPQPQRSPLSVCFGPGPCFPHLVCKCWCSLEFGPGWSSPHLLCMPPETLNPSPGRQDPSLRSLPCLSAPQ